MWGIIRREGRKAVPAHLQQQPGAGALGRSCPDLQPSFSEQQLPRCVAAVRCPAPGGSGGCSVLQGARGTRRAGKGFPQKMGRREEDASLAVSFILSLLNFGCRSCETGNVII